MTLTTTNARVPVGTKTGHLAREYGKKRLALQAMHSAAGWYLGTADDAGPFSRESLEYWPQEAGAIAALDSGVFTQRDEP